MSIQLTATEEALVDDCYPFIVDLIRDAGRIVRTGYSELSKVVDTKDGSWDLVTRYDRDVEQHLIGGIRRRYADHCFVAEETAAANTLTEAPTWIIDPIDGTNNFVHGIPMLAISVALVLRKGSIVVGVVYNPVTEEMYRCRVGGGAFLNDVPIRCSRVETVSVEHDVFELTYHSRTLPQLDGAIYAHEVSFARVERVREKNIKRIHKFAALAQGVRSFGCAALTLAYVARGAIDGYQLDDLKPWDVAAGALLIREAGGAVYSTDGSEFDVMRAYLVCAGTEKLCRELIDGIAEAATWTMRIG